MKHITEINKIIQEAVKSTRNKAKKKIIKLQEPDFTAALAVEFPSIMSKSKTFPNVRFGGCFIHQSPMATFNGGRCELGDLMIFVHKQTMDGDRYNASLVQIKKTDKSPVKITAGNELKQLFLYENWPSIFVKQLRSQYDIFPKTCTKGGTYCIIKDSERQSVQFYMAEPLHTMQCDSNNTLGRYIVNMIDWQAGRVIADEKNKDSDEWSRLIWDLLHYCETAVFKRNNSGYVNPNPQRGTLCFLQQMLDDPKAFSVDFIQNDDNASVNEDENNRGFAILFVEVNENETVRNITQ